MIFRGIQARQEAALVVFSVALAAVLCRSALRAGQLLGVPSGESWGRALVTRQIARWWQGTPVGQADLLGWPEQTLLWPIDPALQLIQVPAELLLGPGQGLALAAVVVLSVSGWATGHLALRLGASLPAALSAALLVEGAPYLLRNLQDAVLEAAAIGFAALAAAQIAAAVATPTGWRLLWVGLSVLLLSLVSPYYTVYLALGCGLCVPLVRRRSWLWVAAASALACGLALLPLLLTEGGAHGRFSLPSGGYQLNPGPLVTVDGQLLSRPRLNPVGASSGWAELLYRTPGGAAVLLAAVLSLLLPGGRRWAALGAVFFVGGPGIPMLLRALEVPGVRIDSPLQWLLKVLPATASLGNPTRLLAPWILLSAVGFALAASRLRRGRLLIVGVSALALVELSAQLPGLVLPSTAYRAPASVLSALEGATVVFPSGDFPLFHPDVAPKEALFLAGVAGVAVPADYGRFRIPADLAEQWALSGVSGAPLSAPCLEMPAPPAAGFASLLLLEDRLSGPGRAALRDWLVARGARERAAGEGMSAWDITGVSLR